MIYWAKFASVVNKLNRSWSAAVTMKSHELVACSASDQTHANVTTSLVKFRDRFFHDVASLELHPTKNEPNTLYQTDI